ncbi:protein-glutamate O-methyltransferase CheR [Bacillus sp. 31A1R]|uniref:protein-glutamate O-methyltransferase n=1 Tax=Robertmurraya mangrovi TaxID=3098077 RepID=A0ABU5J3X2_9BACI|nr:protein-glutamate O-methyltransferase CheR [Bacillus sp. 31A1R]MDZ5474109.1 protein-glutamate O-methyltransferase CheR [Bacillus sp. 31A1R]
MDNISLKQLSQIVYYYCGLNYVNNLSSLEVKISKRLQDLNLSIWEYIRLLEESKSEWDQLVELLTINETYFYREEKQLTVLRDYILPQHHQPLKIWSAACSTGEEPYSLAIVLSQSDVKGQVTGTDINKRVLEAASNGVYNKRSLSFRRIPPQWLSTYFDESENEYSVKESIKELVEFKYLNLLDEKSMQNQQNYDVIFCRNVLIYFDAETVEKVVRYFYHSLKKGGYLFLGHAENISNLNIGFETLNTQGTFYYRKG